jgi:ribose/xylose/arabinose/galactoside ABC-type transport system permease subunit
MDAIASVVIGGTLLSCGVGYVFGFIGLQRFIVVLSNKKIKRV